MTPRYVCAFRGRRDGYQAPLALAETDQLDQFITDIYAQPWVRLLARLAPASVQTKIDFRYEPGIPPSRVRCLWGTTLLEHARHRLGCTPMQTYRKLDPSFAHAAARRARQTRSHLFLYSSYALQAFTARYRHTPHKVLFQYHPHPEWELRLLKEDSVWQPYADTPAAYRHQGLTRDTIGESDREAFRYADLIVCASTATKRSLLDAGADESKCRVIPYGIDIPPIITSEPSADTFHAVYAGRGEQRKGLHHLLLAWARASLPPSSRLTLVCRTIHPSLQRLATSTPGVQILPGVSRRELDSLYARSSLFVMPSLLEGFGQVYLEAMAQGCPVLGTENTCLPDLGHEADGIFLTRPGAIDEMAEKLTHLARLLPNRNDLRQAARACAGRHTWQRFRQSLRETLPQ